MPVRCVTYSEFEIADDSVRCPAGVLARWGTGSRAQFNSIQIGVPGRQVRRKRNALKRRQSEPLLNLTNDFLPEVIFNKFRVACPTQHPRLVGYRTNSLNCGVLQNNPPLL
jgi:hypothetical protein